MKKLSLFLLIIIVSVNLHGQNLPPYSGKPFVSSTDNEDETQMTYFDLGFVSGKVKHFVTEKLGLKETQTKTENGTVTHTFESNSSNKGAISFIYSVQAIDDEFLITEVQIKGSAPLMVDFYTQYWTHTVKPQNSSIKSQFLKDDIAYYPNNAKPYVTINNSAFENVDAFLKKRESQTRLAAQEAEALNADQGLDQTEVEAANKAQQELIQKEREAEAAQIRTQAEQEKAARKAAFEQSQEREQAKLNKLREAQQQNLAQHEKLQAERAAANKAQRAKSLKAADARKLKQAKADTLRNTFTKKLLFDVVKSDDSLKTDLKRGSGGSEVGKVLDKLKEQMGGFMKNQKEGTYVIMASYKRVYDDIQGLTFKVRKFNKPTVKTTNKD